MQKFITRLIPIKFNSIKYQSIALSTFYQTSFDSNSIGAGGRPVKCRQSARFRDGATVPRSLFADSRPNASPDRHRTKSKVVEHDESHLVAECHDHAVTGVAAAIFLSHGPQQFQRRHRPFLLICIRTLRPIDSGPKAKLKSTMRAIWW